MTTILVVDDEPAVCELIKKFLTSLGFSVRTAQSGEEALEKLQEEEPSLVLLDIKMPGIDGIEVLRRIRADNKKLPVFLATAVSDENVRREAFNLGATKWITKPISLMSLRDKIYSEVKPPDKALL